MKADSYITEIHDEKDNLIYSAVPIREWDNSIVLYVIARVEWSETLDELYERARRIAKVLTVDRPPKRNSAARAAE
jgi:hypothetical protein